LHSIFTFDLLCVKRLNFRMFMKLSFNVFLFNVLFYKFPDGLQCPSLVGLQEERHQSSRI